MGSYWLKLGDIRLSWQYQYQVDNSEASPDLQQIEQGWKLEDGFWKRNEYNGKKNQLRVAL